MLSKVGHFNESSMCWYIIFTIHIYQVYAAVAIWWHIQAPRYLHVTHVCHLQYPPVSHTDGTIGYSFLFDMYAGLLVVNTQQHPVIVIIPSTLQWCHNEHHGISNHQPQDCLLNLLFRRRPKKTSNLSVTSLCAGNSPVTAEFPTQRASNVENVFIWWRHQHLQVSRALFCIQNLVKFHFVYIFMWFIYPYHSGLLHWHWGNHMIAPVPVKQPWKICVITDCRYHHNISSVKCLPFIKASQF